MERFITSCVPCGIDDGFLEDYHVNVQARSDIRASVLAQCGTVDETSSDIDAVISAIVAEDEYVLGSWKHIHAANEGVRRTSVEWDTYFERIGVDPVTKIRTGKPSKIVPRFAAAVALHIRSKLGRLENNRANRLLVERKYFEICRKRGVRDSDSNSHFQYVFNAVFNEDVLEMVGTTHRRAPWWLKMVDDYHPTSVAMQAC
jgi:hypothetical protein